MDIEGWLRPRRAPACVTFSSSRRARKVTSRLRSTPPSGMPICWHLPGKMSRVFLPDCNWSGAFPMASVSSIDLNLLIALGALLEERNLTRAGEKTNMSQPAMSGALARLRRHFDDELL